MNFVRRLRAIVGDALLRSAILNLQNEALSILMSFVRKKDEQLPWWGMLLAFFLAWIVTLPAGVIQAITNQEFFAVEKDEQHKLPTVYQKFSYGNYTGAGMQYPMA
ncbi:hypothetical protein DCAR_0205288 [Daucus carota subsp. sativus]|uniref:Uncharacterized protein n=1 Tax=Daucus carota subsp. sativus TaxID=79200 RepID=A0A175YC66_DAUCS|nr:hypothetical protein DCAR_0205288 [Daucus carota subsp. sativus]